MSMCLWCWEEASRRHLIYGEGESVTAVCGRLIDSNWCGTADEHVPVEDRTSEQSGAEHGSSPATPARGEG